MISIPSNLLNILQQNAEYDGIVKKTISDFSTIVAENKLEFFKDYTDHGIKHINSVLLTCSQIITEDSIKLLNSKDVLVLILSVILHDLGMHVNIPGFIRLIEGEFDQVWQKNVDKNRWEEEWLVYFDKAKKMNDDQLLKIFGKTDVYIEYPAFDNIDDQSKLLIGEFLRKSHHRLSHEIALNGFPGAKENIEFAAGLEQNLIFISGLVARSHGMPLRETFEILKNKFGTSWKTPYDIKVIYLMGVLRIADYLQISNDRANNLVFRTKLFTSNFSKEEWLKHNSVKFIDVHTDDPELINVHAEPNDSRIFLGLKSLLKDIQSELDITWAILGEVYGNTIYKELRFNYRRIKSNIDDIEKFSNTIEYIPREVKYKAEPEILKLLFAPLYGKDPAYGVRELLQNAVDACIEFEFLSKLNSTNEKRIDYKPCVEFSISEIGNKYYLEISDNGIGMNEDIIINYFFKAGSSFRSSHYWINDFTTGRDSKVIRNGRFGIGALGIFLLGDEFELETRYFNNEKYGLKLKASLNSTQIEIFKDSKVGNGTRIKILLNAEIQNNIKENKTQYDWFNWFYLDSPKIIYRIPKSIEKLFRKYEEENVFADYTSSNWLISKPTGYDRIYWTIERIKDMGYDEIQHVKYVPRTFASEITLLNKAQILPFDFEFKVKSNLICNGFLIPNGHNNLLSKDTGMDIKVMVFDKNANLPLTLDRKEIYNNKLPFFEDILKDLSKDIIARLLTVKFKINSNRFQPTECCLKYKSQVDISNDIIVNEKGYFLNHNVFLAKLKITKINKICLEGETNYNIIKHFKNYTLMEINDKTKHILDLNFSGNNAGLEELIGKRKKISRQFVKRAYYNVLFDSFLIRKNLRFGMKIEEISSDWVLIKDKEDLEIDSLEKNTNMLINFNNTAFIEEEFVPYYEDTLFNNILSEQLTKYLSPHFLIPFDLGKRKELYSIAFEELEENIKRYL